jgi:hypothetical protein
MEHSTFPVALFVYNRPDHTRRTLEHLAANTLASETDLYVFSDGPKDEASAQAVSDVRKVIRAASGFRSITFRDSSANGGLARSVISGVTDILSLHPAAIVLEDDNLTASNFLAYMNAGLRTYAGHPHVGTVTGYSPPLRSPVPGDVYLSPRHSSWGWGTYRDIWQAVDWSISDYPQFLADRRMQQRFNAAGNDMSTLLRMQMNREIDSWSIRFDYACFKRGLLCVTPTSTMVVNIGFDGSGVHCGTSGEYSDVEIGEPPADFDLPPDLHPDAHVCALVKEHFSVSQARLMARRGRGIWRKTLRSLKASVR